MGIYEILQNGINEDINLYRVIEGIINTYKINKIV